MDKTKISETVDIYIHFSFHTRAKYLLYFYVMNYKQSNPSNWSGRETNPNLGIQYWYQAVKCIDIQKEDIQADIALIGYECDEGVRRNLGRTGAKDGSDAIRKKLGSVAWHSKKTVVDVGNVVCIGEDLETCQDVFAKKITSLLKSGVFPIALGGGHDIAYAHFKGIFNALSNPIKNIGIVNFDAHFDLRPKPDGRPNSGTPFNQILEEHININYFPIGIQAQANTAELFEIAKQNNVQYLTNFDCENQEKVKETVANFISENDVIYITIDIDGFSSAYAPGVSAPSPLGFTPNFVMNVLSQLFESKKVISIDLAEMNPKYDVDNHTASLAARFVDFIVTQF